MEDGNIRKSNPYQLRNTILFLVSSRFGLRGGKEHCALSRYPTCQIQIEEINGKRCLVYHERVSKTNQGGIQSHRSVTLKVLYAFCSGNRPRCFIELFNKYQFYCPKPTIFWNTFYLQTDENWKLGNDFWYTRLPVGKGPLASVAKMLMEGASISGNWSNHSLRITTAMRFHNKGFSEPIVQEATGHRSNAVHCYSRTNYVMKEKKIQQSKHTAKGCC